MTKEKQVGFFVPNLYPNYTGGMEIFNFFLIKEVSKVYPVVIFTSSNYVGNLPNIIKLKSRLVGLKRYGFGKFSHFISMLFSFVKSCPNVLHIPYTSNFGSYAYWFWLLKYIFNIKFIVVIHGGGLKPWSQPKTQKSFFKRVDKIIAVSEPIREEYSKRLGHNNIEIIYPLVPFPPVNAQTDELKKKWGIPVSSISIIMVGTLKPLKCPDILLEAFLSLGERYIVEHNLNLVFAGSGEMKKELESRENSSGLADRVFFLGNVPFEQIGEIYSLASIYVIASWFEGLPKSLVGAMAYGLPVIGSNVNGINSIIRDGENGLLFKVNSSDNLSIMLKKYIENETLAKKHSRSINELYEKNFSYKRHISKVLEVYNSLD